MNGRKRICGLLGLVVLLSGCYSTGMSIREKGGLNYTSMVYSLYDDGQDGLSRAGDKLKKPLRLAVAQVGENAPPESLLEALAAERSLVSRIVPLPAAGEGGDYGSATTAGKDALAERARKMRRMAGDLGADYMFVFGGSLDYGNSGTWLQFFDVTLLGAYVVPSTKIQGEGRAAGALIDVHTGKALLLVNAEAKRQARAPSALYSSRSDEMLVELRDALAAELGRKLIHRLEEE